jgi:hypothetical protein
MPTNPTSTGPFTWVGSPPPNNVNFGDYHQASKINEIKNNTDWLDDNTEYCFNEKLDYYADKDTVKEVSLYSARYVTKRDTQYEDKYDFLCGSDRSTLYESRRDTRYSTNYDVYRGSYLHWERRIEVSPPPGHNTAYGTYHSGVNNDRRDTVQSSDWNTVESSDYPSRNNNRNSTVNNSANQSVNSTRYATQHSARHVSLCSILDGP